MTIALETAASKIAKICILELQELYLIAYDHQFVSVMCIFMVKSIVKFHYRQSSTVYTHKKMLTSQITGPYL